MDTTYDDLTKGRKHEIVVQVLECKPASRSKRAYELTVEDINGTDFDLVIWEKSNVGRATDWSEGVWYRLGGITVNEWDFGKVAHGTSELTVEQIGHRPPHTPTNIVYGTDSHLGKSIHSYGKGSWTVNPEDGFSAMVDYAVDNDVDAVVHGGDLFHNPGSGIDEGDILSCQILLHELANSGIPFYFIYGNHERDAGRQVMQELINDGLATHLEPVIETIS